MNPSGRTRIRNRSRLAILAGAVPGLLLFIAIWLFFSPTGSGQALLVAAAAVAAALAAWPTITGRGDAHCGQDELKRELARRDELLDQLRHDLQATRDYQQQLLATLGQEVRTPLEDLLEMTDLLLDSDLDARARHLAKAMRNSAEGLSEAITEMLVSCKSAAITGPPTTVREIDLRTLLEETVRRFRNRARQKGLGLTIHLSADLRERITSDPEPLSRLLENLLGITLTLAREGEIRLEADGGDEADHLMLRFCSTAPAGSRLLQAHLFDALAHSGDSLPEHLDATGRALVVARQLAASLGGDLSLEIAEDSGFALVLSLPYAIEAVISRHASPSPPDRNRHGGRKKILLADDDPINRLVAVTRLQDLGFEVTTVQNGRKALELVKQKTFDVILMDCHMTEMEGFSATAAIREWEKSQGRRPTPIIALTTELHAGNRSRCRAVGIDDHLGKPYSISELTRILEHWSRKAGANGQDPDTIDEREDRTAILDQARLDSLRALGRGRSSAVLEKAVRHYLDHTPAEIERLRRAIADGNAESVRLIAHNLKSSSGMLGAGRLAALFSQLEKKARESALAGASQIMDAIEEILPATLQALSREATQPATAEHTSQSATGEESGRVLLVDDDPAFRLITSASLRKAGFLVQEAANGTEALEMVASDPPELVLLDALMDDIDGFEICAKIRRMPQTRHVPVLMVTGLEDTDSVNRAFQAGAAGFITKPVNYPVLVHRIRFQIRAARESIELRESQQQLAIAQHLARLGHWRWDTTREQFVISDQLAEMCELEESDPQDSWEGFLELVHPDDREQVRLNIRSALDKGTLKPIDYRIRTRSGKELFIHQELTLVAQGTLLGTVQDVTRQYQSEQRIRKLAYSDELTGLASRSYFLRHLEDAINIASRHGEKFSLLYLDLDSFKDINDTLGHDVGDELLKVVARRLLKALRKSDFAARLGGDEFCILVDNLSSSYAAEVANRCLEEVNRPIDLGSQTFNPRISIGIANFPADGQDAQTLLKAADSAMYAAKQAGKHRYAFYRPELTLRAQKRLDTEHELHRALEEGQFELHYQPQISLATGRVQALEALVRWNHPKRGLVSPAEFIPVAERIGLIKPLGRWVLETACVQARQWRDAGLPEIRMAVNISPLHFRDRVIVEQVGEILEKTGWPANQLELEVTESVVQTEQDNMENFLQLKELGVHIAIDDFGTGYSSLSSLKKLPIDCLKVDRLFVRDMVTDPESATLVGTIVALARALNLEVVAEGVETEEELQILTALGCGLVQGYLFSKPVEAERIPPLLERDFSELSAASPPLPNITQIGMQP